jgi:hypothetical protein
MDRLSIEQLLALATCCSLLQALTWVILFAIYLMVTDDH